MLLPDIILNEIADGSLNNNEGFEKLLLIIESSNDPVIRIKALETLGKIDLNDKGKNVKLYKILEYCLLSDDNSTVQYASAVILVNKFPKKAKKPLSWVIQHEKSAYLKLKLIELSKTFDKQFYNYLFEKFVESHTRKYIRDGVCTTDAIVLWLLEDLDGRILNKIDLEEEVPCVVEYYNQDCYYKMNSRGNIVGIYISSYPNRDITYTNTRESHFQCKSINFIPEQICSLLKLEEFYFNSAIPPDEYPDSILTLKRAMERGYNGHERKALEVNPRYSLAWYSLANNLYDKLKYTESLDACFKCLEIDPHFQAALMLRDTILSLEIS
ncbi:MAG: hypothetical protein ACTSQD_06530 [Promethearchaeota archaeon]